MKKIALVLVRAEWHTSLRLRVPDHVYLHFLPSYFPQQQPAEHLWPLTNAPLINRHFASMGIWRRRKPNTASHSRRNQPSSAPLPSSIGGHSVSTNGTRRGGSSMKQYPLR